MFIFVRNIDDIRFSKSYTDCNEEEKNAVKHRYHQLQGDPAQYRAQAKKNAAFTTGSNTAQKTQRD